MTILLSPSVIDFFQKHTRPLEQARFAYHFQGGDRVLVLDALTSFQNEDGGFGKALEPDIRMPHSSVLASTVALQILRSIDAPAHCPVVTAVIAYLIAAYDREIRGWHNVSPDVDKFPHAPWWTYQKEHGLTHSTSFQANAASEVLAHLYHYQNLVESSFLAEVTEEALVYFEVEGKNLEMHDLLCAQRLLATQNIPENVRRRVFAAIVDRASNLVERSPSKWSGYCLHPLTLAPFPDSPFAPLVAKEIEENIRFEKERQNSDGSWSPSWSWGPLYPDIWPLAEKEWRGIVTLTTLRSIHAYAAS